MLKQDTCKLMMSTPFESIAWEWLSSIQASVKESTLEHYRYTLSRYILPVLGALPIHQINESVLEDGLREIICPAHHDHRSLGMSMAKECLVLVRRICRFAAHKKLVPPMQIEICLPRKSDNTTQPLTEKECEIVQRYILQKPSPRKIGLLLCLQMGLRIGEVCGLQWGDFNLEQGTLFVRRTVKRIYFASRSTKVIVQTPKTASSKRKLPIPGNLLEILMQIRGTASNRTWFLSGKKSKPVEPRSFRNSIHLYLEQAGVHSVHPHMLRHSFATICLQAGCDIKTLSELMGHSSADITMKRYVHTNWTRMKSEMNRIFGLRRIGSLRPNILHE